MDTDPVKETEKSVPSCESLPPSASQEGLVKCGVLIISAHVSLILQSNIGVACNSENWKLLSQKLFEAKEFPSPYSSWRCKEEEI